MLGGGTGSVAVVARPDGGREEVGFFPAADGSGAALFGCRHVPAVAPRAGLVVCSPILADFGANYQREVLLGRRLAAAGIVTQRYHPRGIGQSDGDGADVTVDTLVADALAAAEHLRAVTGIDRVSVLGTRFGALAAAAASNELGAPLAIWEPVVEPRRYMREGLRARAVHRMKGTTDDASATEDPDVELARRGWIDVLGLPIGAELFATPADRGLAAAVGERPRAVLLVQLEAREDLRPDYGKLIEQWSAGGFDVSVKRCPTDETWWFVHDRLAPVDDVLGATVDWLVAR